jgi:hypothetical protein
MNDVIYSLIRMLHFQTNETACKTRKDFHLV